MFSLYRSAREVIGIYQDLRQLYEMAAEAYARREPAPYEVELISDFRNCCSCAYSVYVRLPKTVNCCACSCKVIISKWI